ncbi:MAG TPA: alternative ribosome rescue aminoacyl-tRNA hydrolase ArfB [Myxococcota bacterium]|nr:alternative ribosome rescue aminoacyl-tRNA hydrolase ArfB [Myxococcota bacterium]
MEADLPIDDTLVIPGAELRVLTSRSGGPGGQGVNTTNSRVQLQWRVQGSSALDEAQQARLLRNLASRIRAGGLLQVAVQSERSQHRNRQLARERLAELVREALVIRPKRKKRRISRGAKQRRLQAKRARSERKASRKRVREDQ